MLCCRAVRAAIKPGKNVFIEILLERNAGWVALQTKGTQEVEEESFHLHNSAQAWLCELLRPPGPKTCHLPCLNSFTFSANAEKKISLSWWTLGVEGILWRNPFAYIFHFSCSCCYIINLSQQELAVFIILYHSDLQKRKRKSHTCGANFQLKSHHFTQASFFFEFGSREFHRFWKLWVHSSTDLLW